MREQLSVTLISLCPHNVLETIDVTYLNKPRVNQDPRAERVQHAAHDARGRAARVVRRADAEPDRDAQRGHDAEAERAQDGDEVVVRGELHLGKARADSEAFECFYGHESE